MNDYIEARVKEVARYIVENKSTIRETAKKFGWAKATIQKDLTERLRIIDPILYKKVRRVLNTNIAERSLRGGMATKSKFKGGSSYDS